MTESIPLRVRKDPFEVELALVDRPPRLVELYLAEHGSRGFARQEVIDLVEQAEAFLPARDAETGEWEAFNARGIVWIGIDRPADDQAGWGGDLYEHRKFVRLALNGGVSLEGEVLYSAPDGWARLVDLLNRRERFLQLWDGDRLFLVNKDSVLRIVETGPES